MIRLALIVVAAAGVTLFSEELRALGNRTVGEVRGRLEALALRSLPGQGGDATGAGASREIAPEVDPSPPALQAPTAAEVTAPEGSPAAPATPAPLTAPTGGALQVSEPETAAPQAPATRAGARTEPVVSVDETRDETLSPEQAEEIRCRLGRVMSLARNRR